MTILLWLIFGLFLGSLLLLFARRFRPKKEKKILAAALVIAAMVYVFFALVWGDLNWFFIELMGIPVYSLLACLYVIPRIG